MDRFSDSAGPRTRDFFGQATEETPALPRHLAADAIPRCTRKHLRSHHKTWIRSVPIPAPPGAVGAIECAGGERWAFYAQRGSELLEMRRIG